VSSRSSDRSDAFTYYKMEADPRRALAHILSKPISPEEQRIKVRKISSVDIDAFCNLYNRVFLAAPDPFRELTRQDVERLLREDSIFLAEMYGQPVGFIVLVLYDEDTEVVGEIASIGVLAQRRRHGVATALIRAAATFLSDEGIKKATCEVFAENMPSYELITAHGFKKVGERLIPREGNPEEVEAATRTWKILRRAR